LEKTVAVANLSWQNNQDAYWKEQLDIDFTARTLYYRLLLQTETTAIERKKAESARLVHDTTRALVRAGKLAEVELIRADISARQDGRRIQNAENDLEKAMNEAKDLISLPTEQTISLTSKLTYEPFKFPLDRLIKLAIEKNPDVQTSRRQVEVSEIALKRTRERDNPQLNTSGSYSLTRDRSDSTLPINPYSWNVKLGVDWPIYDADQTRLQTKQSEISYLNSKRSYENRIRQLTVDVQNAYLEVKRSEEQIADFEPQKLSAERNVQAIRLQYKNGLTRLTDVFDAENQLRDLELEYLRLLVTFNTARDQLKVLVGTDLSDLTRGSDQ
jgi:outer membrane protein TolC